jgi:hypothetical protein
VINSYNKTKIPDVGQRNCPKHVEFYSKNKLEKLVHLFGFIIRRFPLVRISDEQLSGHEGQLKKNVFV